MLTVADVLKRIERIKKDLEYVRSFQEKWREQRDRFPKIYEGIVEQERAFLQRIEDLRNLGVNAQDDLADAAIDSADDARPQLTPNIESNGRRRRGDSSDDQRAGASDAANDKLRARPGVVSPGK